MCSRAQHSRSPKSADSRAALQSSPPQAEAERAEEKHYLYQALYTCSELEQEHRNAGQVVTELFDLWVSDPGRLPESYVADVEGWGAPRVVADYIAGMTDNFILQQYRDAELRSVEWNSRA